MRRSAGVSDGSRRLTSRLAMRCCWRNSVRRVDSVGCAVNTGSMLRRPSSVDRLLERVAERLAAAGSIPSRPPGCGVLLSLRYSRRRRTRCTFSAMLTIWNQVANARIRSRRLRRGATLGAHDEFDARLAVVVATADRALPVALDFVEQRLAALVAQHFAHERAERVDVVAQRGVLRRETKCLCVAWPREVTGVGLSLEWPRRTWIDRRRACERAC